jgi:hypothetical protein
VRFEVFMAMKILDSRLRVFENKQLGSEKSEVTRGWRKVHEEFPNLYSCLILLG